MSRRSTLRFSALVLGAASALAAGPPGIVLQRISAPPPAAAAPELRHLVAGEALRVAGPGRISATFWLRARIPEMKAAPDSSPVLGERIALPGIPPAAFVGFVSFDRPWRDYRDRLVPAGVYTARYLVQPAIKEHKGASAFRDFLILTPASIDVAADTSPRELIGRSAAATGSEHPLVMAVFPLPDGAHPPRILVNPLEQPMLGVRLGSLAFGIVFEGHGRTEET